MKSFFRKSIAAVLTLGILFGILGGSIVYADAEDYEQSSLGALAACARHTLGTFSGVPACVNANGDLHICENNFPDNVFREYVANLQGAEDGYFTPGECGKIEESLNVCDDDNIKTLQGIEFFTCLKSLNCDGTGVSELNLNNNTALTKLSCRKNHIRRLNISGCSELVELDCAYNDLTELNVGHNTQLVYLDCRFNQLTKLDVSDCMDLSVLICSNNNITELFINRRDGNWENLIVSPQTSTLPLVKRGPVWTADLRSLVEDVSRIETDSISEGTYDWQSGWIIFTEKPDSFTYECYIGKVQQTMQVTVNLIDSEPETPTPIPTPNPNPGLGASEACEGHVLGTFSGVSACVNENGDLHICENDFPDDVFREYIANLEGGEDGYFTAEECGKIISVEVHQSYAAQTLQGIEFFINLFSLDCAFNQLTELDTSNNAALELLYCGGNQLRELDIRNNTALKILDCYYNQLKELDISSNAALEVLYCDINQLTELDTSNNTALEKLYCHRNQLENLNVRNNTALKILDCEDNQLTELDVRNNIALEDLRCENNQLRNLDVSNNLALKDLLCYSNQLAELDVSNNTALDYLVCYSNQLAKLDVSNNLALTYLNCGDNRLTELDTSNNTAFEILHCYGNQLTKLDLTFNTNLQYLNCDNNQLTELVIIYYHKNLRSLSCNNNQLTNLYLGGGSELRSLECSSNQLTELNLSDKPGLNRLACADNQLTALDLSNCYYLYELICYNNSITRIEDRANSGYIGRDALAISPQIHTLPLTQKGSVWTVDLHALGDSRAIYGIREDSLSEGILDKSTGLVTFTEKPTSFTFESSAGISGQTMQVIVYLTEPEATYKATINGTEYVYAAGEQVTLSVDAFYLDGNWGYRFDTWTGDVDAVADVKSSTTTFTMPAQDVTITANHYLIGDVDGSGVVDAVDAAAIIRMANGTMTPTLAGDITGTGVVDAMSAANIARYIAGTYTPVK